MLLIPFALLLIYSSADSKPIQDIDFGGLQYRKLADNVDEKLRYVEHVENNKPKVEDIPTTSLPSVQFLITTPAIDPKLDEEIDEESSSSEEEDHSTAKPTNVTLKPQEVEPSIQHLLVEEQEVGLTFDGKEEIRARKPIPQQILKSANSVPTTLPQSASASKPTKPEPPTTPLTTENNILKDVQSTQRPVIEGRVMAPPQHNPDQDIGLIEQHEEEVDESRQNFDGKPQSNQGSLIYGPARQITPDIHGQSPMISPQLTTPQPTTVETTKESISNIDIFFRSLKCSVGDCDGVFVTKTTMKPRELQQMGIIRKVRHDEALVEIECKCKNRKKENPS